MFVQRRREMIILLICLIGFCAGSALPELLRMGTGSYAGFFSLYSFQKFEGTAVNPWEIFPYVLSVRLSTLLFLWMSSYTAAGLLFHAVYALWLSAAAGMLLALFILRDGYEGLLFFCCCLFPQWIVYAAMWKREASFLFRQHRQRLSEEGIRSGFLYRKDLSELAILTGLCLFGSLVESFLGIWTLKIFLQILT